MLVAPSAGAATAVTTTAITTTATESCHWNEAPVYFATIFSITPHRGLAGGGDTVTISGEELIGAVVTAVWFGEAKAVSFHVDSESSMTATAPPGAGTAEVRVEYRQLAEICQPGNRFVYTYLRSNSLPYFYGATEEAEYRAWIFSGHVAAGELAQPITLPAGSDFSGTGELNPETDSGSVKGNLSIPAFTTTLKIFGLPIKLGMTLTQVGALEGTVTKSETIPGDETLTVPLKLNLSITSLGVGTFTMPTHCSTTTPIGFSLKDTLSREQLLRVGWSFAGTVSLPHYECEGGFLGWVLGLALNALVSGPELPYSLSVKKLQPIFSNYTAPGISRPGGITAGPDGALWFTNQGSRTIGRITTAGAVSSFADGSPAGEPLSITSGSDGALWFNVDCCAIGRITTSGAVNTFNLSTHPLAITGGPDGALWFTNGKPPASSIGRITTSGTITDYADSNINLPLGITAGPDGALWFTDEWNDSIGRITTAGTITHYDDPAIRRPVGITVGPDGALWFTNDYNRSIGRITTSGVVTNYTYPTIYVPGAITAGPDGALWFINDYGRSIGRITTAGVFTNYTDPAICQPRQITAGPDRALWFTNTCGSGSIGRIGLPLP